MDEWGKPLKKQLTKGSVHFIGWQALENNPGMSMFTEEARRAIAFIIADALPTEDEEDK